MAIAGRAQVRTAFQHFAAYRKLRHARIIAAFYFGPARIAEDAAIANRMAIGKPVVGPFPDIADGVEADGVEQAATVCR